ncbi:hypothetical protein IV203_032081 [Nitzschia inconspicua]|uniref:Uncharacterized protein n=1 Tax=Nitzschia inconspicua TaxID=303405 RepID=A0A9K3P872_9STRA|nr:hypothetical protein IV203_011277 [Nitzschia inconspicua]KAG7369338.1 hypothetical protein IV203_032081 [Nitzschia inconspicua]
MAISSVSAAQEVEDHEPQSRLINGRYLQAFDFFDDDLDLCDNSANPLDGRPELGPCDKSRFPQCSSSEEICYNRKPSRDHFHRDDHQHQYYIQYDRVFCYPRSWGGCSSCSPGRYCKSERRCILQEEGYPCAQWF